MSIDDFYGLTLCCNGDFFIYRNKLENLAAQKEQKKYTNARREQNMQLAKSVPKTDDHMYFVVRFFLSVELCRFFKWKSLTCFLKIIGSIVACGKKFLGILNRKKFFCLVSPVASGGPRGALPPMTC